MSTEARITPHHEEPIGPKMSDNRFSPSEVKPHSGHIPIEEGGERPQEQHEALTSTKPLSEVAERLAPVESPADLHREPKLLDENTSPRNKIVAAIAGIGLLGGGLVAGMKLGSNSDNEPTQPSMKPSASAPVVPGPAETAPTVAPSPEVTKPVESGSLINPEMAHEEMVEALTMRATDSMTHQQIFELFTSRLQLWANAGNSRAEYDLYPGGRSFEKGEDFVQGVTNRYDPAFAEALLGTSNVEANPTADNMRDVHADTSQKFASFYTESNKGAPDFVRTITTDPTTIELVEDGGSIIVVRGTMLVSDNGDKINTVATARSAKGLPTVENLEWDLSVTFQKNKDNELRVTFIEEN